jgi:hypothetical protein
VLVALVANQGLSPSLTITWDPAGANQSLTQIGSFITTPGTFGSVTMWALLNPTPGNKVLRANVTSGSQAFMDACAFKGVNSTFGTAFTITTNAGTSNTPTVTVTSATNHMIMAGYADGGTSSFNTTDATQLFVDNGGSQIAAGGQLTSGAASVTMNGHISASDPWAAAAVDISF